MYDISFTGKERKIGKNVVRVTTRIQANPHAIALAFELAKTTVGLIVALGYGIGAATLAGGAGAAEILRRALRGLQVALGYWYGYFAYKKNNKTDDYEKI